MCSYFDLICQKPMRTKTFREVKLLNKSMICTEFFRAEIVTNVDWLRGLFSHVFTRFDCDGYHFLRIKRFIMNHFLNVNVDISVIIVIKIT
jgi:hypothetical protein